MASDIAARVRQIKDRLKVLEQERAELQAELDEVTDALQLGAGRRRPTIQNGQRSLRHGSGAYWAERVLRHRNRPCHIDDLLRDMRQLSGVAFQKASLVSSLTKYVNAGRIFARPQEAVYGLLEPSLFDTEPLR